jgi:hypothetical protein
LIKENKEKEKEIIDWCKNNIDIEMMEYYPNNLLKLSLEEWIYKLRPIQMNRLSKLLINGFDEFPFTLDEINEMLLKNSYVPYIGEFNFPKMNEYTNGNIIISFSNRVKGTDNIYLFNIRNIQTGKRVISVEPKDMNELLLISKINSLNEDNYKNFIY